MTAARKSATHCVCTQTSLRNEIPSTRVALRPGSIAWLLTVLVVWGPLSLTLAAERPSGTSTGLISRPGRAPPAATPGEAPPASVDRDSAMRRVVEQAAAGEWGPAVDTALAAPASARTELLEHVFRAQLAARELPAAEATSRLFAPGAGRAGAKAAVLREGEQAGGGLGPDFQSLIELISSTVAPDSWDEVGGPGSVRPYDAGVRVDPHGLLKLAAVEERGGRLKALSRQVRAADINSDLASRSHLRLVSLRQLESQVSARMAAGRAVPETMQRLAGLTAIRYVFIDVERHDIVIGGPAEGWQYDETGRPIGRETHAPLMALDDLVTLWRVFSPGGQAIFGCSINPRADNLRDLKDFVEQTSQRGPLQPGKLGPYLKELHARLGRQDVEVYGVPATSHVARVLVEADYRMKLIGVDKLDAGPRMPSYFDLLKHGAGDSSASIDALRWWMSMKYAAIMHDPEELSFEIQGASVLVQSENQFVNAQGQHVPTGAAEPINQLFSRNLTVHYAELAERDPIFADLQNIFDLGLVAALVQRYKVAERIGWDGGQFASDRAYRSAQFPAVKEVETVVNHRVFRGRDIVIQVAGGVTAQPAATVADPALNREDAHVGATAARARLAQPSDGRWWWDAAPP